MRTVLANATITQAQGIIDPKCVNWLSSALWAFVAQSNERQADTHGIMGSAKLRASSCCCLERGIITQTFAVKEQIKEEQEIG
jgi:hypothetical protein